MRRSPVVIAGLVVSSALAGSACGGGSPSQPVAAYVQFGGSESDVVLRDSLLEQFERAVLPPMAEAEATVVVGVAGDRTSTAPVLIGTADFADAIAEAEGNSMVEADNVASMRMELLDETTAGLLSYPPSATSDTVSGLALATQVRQQMTVDTEFRVVLLGDAISTTESCNLLLIDLSTPAARSTAIDACTRGLLIDLDDVAVVMGGAGVDPDDALSPERAGQIELFYRELIERFGGELRVYAAELVTEVE